MLAKIQDIISILVGAKALTVPLTPKCKGVKGIKF
jgi:hypothetical protein